MHAVDRSDRVPTSPHPARTAYLMVTAACSAWWHIAFGVFQFECRHDTFTILDQVPLRIFDRAARVNGFKTPDVSPEETPCNCVDERAKHNTGTFELDLQSRVGGKDVPVPFFQDAITRPVIGWLNGTSLKRLTKLDSPLIGLRTLHSQETL